MCCLRVCIAESLILASQSMHTPGIEHELPIDFFRIQAFQFSVVNQKGI
jgi:hypothetical protein